jgi:uncharacterized protein YqeY
MSLEKRVTEEMKAAMKSGDKQRLEAIRSIRASILEFAKSGAGREMNKADETKILNQQAKRRRDAIQMYEDGGRQELADKEKFELEVIEEFMPKQLTDDELAAEIRKVIEQTGAEGMKDMGKVMGASMKATQGRADGNRVKDIVKSLLENA